MWDVVDALRSIPELSDEDMRGVRVAIADRFIAQPCLGDMQSWDLMLFGDGFVPLTCDLFSFHGDFLFSGLHEIVLNFLGPAGLDSSSPWVANRDRSGFHATIDGWRGLSRAGRLMLIEGRGPLAVLTGTGCASCHPYLS